jgi:hypothetical protein
MEAILECGTNWKRDKRRDLDLTNATYVELQGVIKFLPKKQIFI